MSRSGAAASPGAPRVRSCLRSREIKTHVLNCSRDRQGAAAESAGSKNPETRPFTGVTAPAGPALAGVQPHRGSCSSGPNSQSSGLSLSSAGVCRVPPGTRRLSWSEDTAALGRLFQHKWSQPGGQEQSDQTWGWGISHLHPALMVTKTFHPAPCLIGLIEDTLCPTANRKDTRSGESVAQGQGQSDSLGVPFPSERGWGRGAGKSDFL